MSNPSLSASDSYSRRPFWMAVGLLVLAIGIAYANAYAGVWVFDDKFTIINNPHIGKLWPPEHWILGREGAPSSGRPMTGLLFTLNFILAGGPSHFSFHAVSVVIHILAAVVLLLLLHRTLQYTTAFRDRALPLAFAISIIWGVHPLLTSSVTYVSQRAETQMSLFLLLGLYAAVRAREAGQEDKKSSRKRWFTIALVATFCSALSKEVGVIVPVLVALWDRGFVYDSWAGLKKDRRLRTYALLCIPLIPVLLLQFSVPRGNTVQLSGYQGITPLTYLMTQTNAITHYLQLTFWPDVLILDYGWPVVGDIHGDPEKGVQGMGFITVLSNCFPNLIFIGGLFAAACFALRKSPALGFGAASFFLLLAPSSSVIPIISEIMAEHRMYLPSAVVITFVVLALAFAAPWYISSPHRRRQWGVGLLALSVLALGIRTHFQNRVYHDEIRFWEINAEVTPENRRVFHNLASLYEESGQVRKAHAAYQTGLARSPDYDKLMIEYAHFLTNQGDLQRAVPMAFQAVQLLEGLGLPLRPDQAKYYEVLALVLFETGRFTEAEQACLRATQVNPNTPDTYRFLSVIQVRNKAYARSLASYASYLGKVAPDQNTRDALVADCEKSGFTAEAAALKEFSP